ncbi:MAG TPA: hypothetical protein VFV41_00110 [Streptosporangiaceae bacterium]|nr:hypothetical protein [Streptosporangiaceae bacterium]
MSAPVPPAPWVDWTALWQIVVLGLIAGAGLPALFAIGLRALRLSGGRRAQAAGADAAAVAGGSVVGVAAAAVCFAVVLAAVGWGIYAIVSGA